jgi:DNA-binding NarL/FixJ family response regulator
MPGPLVLLVEDEALIALALADDIETAGYRVAGPFHRSRDTLAWLEQQTPDVAIIDIHLRDGSSDELARVLRGRGVPFLVFSGDRRDGHVADAFREARWLSKPVGARQLLETLEDLAQPGLTISPQVMAEASAPTYAL